MKIEIRQTILEDLKFLPELYRQYFKGDTGIQTDYDGMIKKFTELQSDNNYLFISAILNDKLDGFCSVIVNQDIVEKQKPFITIWNLRVSSELRKQGIGRKIMLFIENYAKTINADFITLSCDKENIGAQKFYKKLNYKENIGFNKHL